MITTRELQQLASDATNLANWQIVRDFCDQVYGPGKVATFEIETYSEYNDEGGYDQLIESWEAKDEEGQEVQYDPNLPYWNSPSVVQSLEEGYELKMVDIKTEDEETVQEAFEELLKDDGPYVGGDEEAPDRAFLANSYTKDDLPPLDHTYDLTKMPTINSPYLRAMVS